MNEPAIVTGVGIVLCMIAILFGGAIGFGLGRLKRFLLWHVGLRKKPRGPVGRCLACGKEIGLVNGFLDPWHLFVECPGTGGKSRDEGRTFLKKNGFYVVGLHKPVKEPKPWEEWEHGEDA